PGLSRRFRNQLAPARQLDWSKDIEFRAPSRSSDLFVLYVRCAMPSKWIRQSGNVLAPLAHGWAVEMLWARPHTEKAGRELPQNWTPLQQANPKRQRSVLLTGHSTGDDAPMNKYLHSLNQARWPFAPCLYLSQVANVDGTALEFFRQQVCCRDRVLNRKIDSYTARW